MYRNASPCTGPGLLKCLGCVGHHYGLAKGIPVTLVKKAMNPALISRVDMFLAVSQAVADASGLAADKLPHQVMPNFAPDDVAVVPTLAHPSLERLPDKEFLLFVGDASRQKGIEVLFKAYSGLRNAPPLVVIGRVGRTTPTDIPPNVYMLGPLPHTAIMQAWHRCLFGLAPSIWPDPCPTVAIEAMATGHPVVATRIGGLSDLIRDGETGFLVPPNDVNALRSAMQQLLDHPAMREAMGRAAVYQAAKFQAAAVVPRIEAVYAAVLSSHAIVTKGAHAVEPHFK
jgi:glycosyltransferase involved in cell wall biosynthesis